MSETDTRLRAFLARLDRLDAEDQHDAIVNEVLRTAVVFGRFDAPTMRPPRPAETNGRCWCCMASSPLARPKMR